MNIKLSIPEPCHEDWAKMSPTEKGKHCAVCEKEVFDMTKIPAHEVAEKISQMKSGDVCAQIPTHYLDKPIQLHAAGIGKYGKMGAAGALITAVALSPTISNSVNLFSTISDKNQTVMNREAIHVNGTVIADNNEVISGAKITIKQNVHHAITYSLANGRFVMNLDPQKIKNGKAILQIEKPGFATLEQEIDIDGNMQNGKFILTELMKKELVNAYQDKMIEKVYWNEVTGGKVMMATECVKAELATHTTMSYEVTGGAVVHSVNIDKMEQIYVTEKMEQEKIEMIDIEPVFVNELKTYPNPTVDFVNLELKKEGNYTVSVFAMEGRMVLTENFTSDKLNLNLSSFERGNYIIKVIDNDTQESFDVKVVLMR